MATGALNKAALARAERELATYRRFLPALDLKRRQLLAERAKARRDLADLEAAGAALAREAGERLPMLANRAVDLSGLARLEEVRIGTRNVVGTRLPVVEEVRVALAPYSRLARPHWVDAAAKEIERGVRLGIEREAAAERLRRLEAAVKTVTQRVNLFEKVLIPRAENDIKRIRIALGDAEKAAVVRSKIAKKKHAALALEARS